MVSPENIYIQTTLNRIADYIYIFIMHTCVCETIIIKEKEAINLRRVVKDVRKVGGSHTI